MSRYRWFSVLAGLVAVAQPSPVRAAEPLRPLRVTMIVGGVYHDYDKLPPILAGRLMSRGEMNIEIIQSLASLDVTRLKTTDILLFNTCEQVEVPKAVRDAVIDFVRSGKGLVAMHCSLWSYDKWPEWVPMIGGYAPGHDKYSPFGVTVLDPAHPVMLSAGTRFDITDEPYWVDRRDPAVATLARTADIHKGPKGTPRDGFDPQVWVKPYGQGRVCTITFGHDDKAQSDERFITLLHQAIRWSARRMPDAPHNTLSQGEVEAGYRLLFNGQDLDGWITDPGYWSVENGELIGRTRRDNELKNHRFLVARGEYGDFFLKFSVKLRNNNTGVQFRSRAFDDFVVKGYQADIAPKAFGSLFEQGGPRRVLADGWKDKGEKYAVLDGWNEMTVRAVGPKITITLNGLTTVDYEEAQPGAQPSRGVIALQLHDGEAMEVRYRDIKLQPLETLRRRDLEAGNKGGK